MHWYRVTKRINSRLYDYWQRTYRVGKTVKTENKYIGPASVVSAGVAPNKTFYHGTLETFDHFENEKTGANSGWKNARFGTFFLDNKEQAAAFPDLTRSAGDNRPVHV